MARKNQSNDPGNGLFGETPDAQKDGAATFVMTPEHGKAIRMLVERTNRIKTIQEQHAEDIKGAASAMGLKPGDVKEMINAVIQEEAEGGVVEAKAKKLRFTEQVIETVVKDVDSNQKAAYTEDLDKMIEGHDEFRNNLTKLLETQSVPPSDA